MQIHFYQQWDKQDNQRIGQADADERHGDYKNKLVEIWMSNKGMILLLSVSIMSIFWFSFFLFADDEGQAMLFNQEQGSSTVEQAIPVAKPESMLYTVKPGDTLWAIAGKYYPEREREEAVQMIREKNGFNGATIQAGQTILLP